jgi:hypothetical protein
VLGSRVDAQDPEQVRRRNTVRASNAEHWARELTSARQLVRRGTAKTKCPRCGGDIDDRTGVVFDGGDFHGAQFSEGIVLFSDAEFSDGKIEFGGAQFSGAWVAFGAARFSGGQIFFSWAKFSDGWVDFAVARFSGSAVYFSGAEFYGGAVDFSDVDDWSVPPRFPWTDMPPPGVKLPRKDDQSQA